MEVCFYVFFIQEDGVDFVEVFVQNVLLKVDVIQVMGDVICIFWELQCLIF